MTEEFTIKSVGTGIASVEPDLVLNATAQTRTIFRIQIHNGGVRGWIIQQKKDRSEEWLDTQKIDFRKLKSGEGANVELSTSALLLLVERFDRLSDHLKQHGVTYGRQEFVSGSKDEVIITDSNKAHYINELLSKGHSQEFWDQLTNSDPDLATRLSWSKIQADRTEALKQFRGAIDDTSKSEEWWQTYFSKNKWIFGYGLNYQFTRSLQEQPNYGGVSVAGLGGQRGDYLEKTAAEVSFTVLVEIKKPSSKLLKTEYRNGAWSPSDELAGGITQLQVNSLMWEKEGSVAETNKDIVENQHNTFTVRPRSILVIGRTNSLENRNQIKSFEILRRNLKSPEVVTFDELLERAKYIVDEENDD